MAERATLARPYAEAFFQVTRQGDLQQAGRELDAVAAVAANEQLRRFADAPKADPAAIFNVLAGVAGLPLSSATKNLLHTVIDNGRLAVLPEIAVQFHVLANADSGVSNAVIYSAYPIEPPQLADVVTALEKRFGRLLNAVVRLDAALIGGIRVVVGDEVFDASVKAQLDRMKSALATS